MFGGGGNVTPSLGLAFWPENQARAPRQHRHPRGRGRPRLAPESRPRLSMCRPPAPALEASLPASGSSELAPAELRPGHCGPQCHHEAVSPPPGVLALSWVWGPSPSGSISGFQHTRYFPASGPSHLRSPLPGTSVAPSKTPHTEWLKWQKFIFSSLEGLEIQDLGVGGAGFS